VPRNLRIQTPGATAGQFGGAVVSMTDACTVTVVGSAASTNSRRKLGKGNHIAVAERIIVCHHNVRLSRITSRRDGPGGCGG